MKLGDFLITAVILILLILTVATILDAQSTDHCIFVESTAPVTVLKTNESVVISVGDNVLHAEAEYNRNIEAKDVQGWWSVLKSGWAVKVEECPVNLPNTEVWK